MTATRQPFPGGGTQVDQARQVARDLLRALKSVDPRTARTLVARYEVFGVTWLAPRLDTADPTGWLTLRQAADRLGVSEKAFSMYCSRGIKRGGRDIRINRYPEGYDEREVDDFGVLLNPPKAKG